MDDLTDDKDREYRAVLPALGDGRWTASRKLAVPLALDLGEISEEEVCRRYAMHPDELSAWRRGKVYTLRANRRRYADRIFEGPPPTPLSSLTEAVSRSLGRAQRAILAEIDARPHNKICIYNWHATIAPDGNATMQISQVLRSDRQWVDPIKRSSFSRAA